MVPAEIKTALAADNTKIAPNSTRKILAICLLLAPKLDSVAISTEKKRK